MRFFRRRETRERDLDEEIEAHLTIEVERRIAEGETPESATQSARRDFGNVPLIRETTRRMWGPARLDTLLQDLKYALRRMRRAPGFTAVAIATLALGIGANAAVFRAVDAALFRPLPFPEADRLVRFFSTRNGVRFAGVSRLDLRDVAASARSFEGIAACDRWRKNVAGLGGSVAPEETVVGLVPENYFDLLRIRPLLGRPFTAEENVFGKHFVAAIGAGSWRDRFGSDPRVIGKTLRINGESYTVVAVYPDAIPAWMDRTTAPVSIWTPYVSADMWSEDGRTARDNFGFGRLKRGVSYAAARAELTTLAARLARDHPVDRGVGVEIEPLADTRSGPVRPLLQTLFGAVAMVLGIACANLAGLLLARNSARTRELAVRSALGAGRRRLLRQLLLESLTLSIAGGLAGLGTAWAAGRALAGLQPAPNLPYTAASNALRQFWSAGLDYRMLAFALGASIATAVLFGLAPAFIGTRGPLADALKEGSRSAGPDAGRQRFRRALVVAEVGFSLVLVFSAALLVQTVVRLERRDPGFPSDHLLLGHVFVPPARYPNPDAISRFCEAFGERVRALPGVREASVTTSYPPTLPWRQAFTLPGSPVSRAEDVPETRFAAVDERYLRTLGVKVVRGRDFAESDEAASRPVAIVNEEFVRRFLPGRDPVGSEVRPGPPPGVPPVPLQDFGGSRAAITIVGVARDFVDDGLARPTAPLLLMLFRQLPGLNFGFKDIVVRTSANPESLAPAVARALASLDADLPLGEIRTMETHLGSETADRRFTTALLGVFAALGMVLAMIGAYGVVAYLVSQRKQELGVRIALGAGSADILWLILRYGLVLGAAGVGLGLAGAVAVRRSLAGLLYGVEASDPATLAGAAAALLLLVAAASALPAARAIRIDPVEALRGS